MNVYFHYSLYGFSNTYLVGGDSGGDAIIVDPGSMDANLLEYIEGNGYSIRAVLMTHNHTAHVHGIKTLLKIYPAELYSSNAEIFDLPCTILHDGEHIELCGLSVDVFSVPGHSSDSLAFRIGDCLFTGDALSAGRLGSTTHAHGLTLLYANIKKKLIPQCQGCFVFPGHGPPSSIEAELASNHELASPPADKVRRTFSDAF
jgi:hydroxyacylglutathione hydrolase